MVPPFQPGFYSDNEGIPGIAKNVMAGMRSETPMFPLIVLE